MDAFLDKVRLAFSSGPNETSSKAVPGREAWADEGRTRACVNCDRVFGPELPRHHCRVCDRTVCGHCSSRYIPQSPAPLSTVWLRVCDFCYHLREPLLSETVVNNDQHAASQSHWLRGTMAPPPLLGIPSASASMSRSAKAALKQVPGDLTWDVPAMLEHEFGLSQTDRDKLNAQLHPTDGTTGSPLSPTPVAILAGNGDQPMIMQSMLRNIFALAAEQHLQQLASQLLFSEAVQQRDVWVPVVTNLAMKAVMAVDPHLHLVAPIRSGQGYTVRDEQLRPLEPGSRIKYPDPCDRIKVKKILDVGSPTDSMVFPGVVCKRNLARKNMASLIDKPCRVVLISGGIDSSKGLPDAAGGSTLHTLENVSYEHNVLQLAHQVVARLLELEVELVLVEGLVAGKVMEYMASHRITLVHNISRSMLERLAPCMGCDVTDRWQLLTSRNVGVCRSFRVDPFGLMPPASTPHEVSHTHVRSGSGSGVPPGVGMGGAVTLTHWVGARPLASTIVLRGAGEEQAVRIKRVVKFLVQVAYHARLECCFQAAQLTAAFAAVGEEVPLSVALGGLEAYRTLAESIVSSSVERSLSRMPNGLMLSLSPHISMWDASIASEYEDVLSSLEPPPPPPAPPTTQRPPLAPGAGSPVGAARERRSIEAALTAAALSSSLYGAAIQASVSGVGGVVSLSTGTGPGAGNRGSGIGTGPSLSPSPPASPRLATHAQGGGESPGNAASGGGGGQRTSGPGQPPSHRSSGSGGGGGAPFLRRSMTISQPMTRTSSSGLPSTAGLLSPSTLQGNGVGVDRSSASSARRLQSMRSGPMTLNDLDDLNNTNTEDMGGLSASAIAALAVAAGRGIMPGMTSSSPLMQPPVPNAASQDEPPLPPGTAPSASPPLLVVEETSSVPHFTDPLRSSMEAPNTPPGLSPRGPSFASSTGPHHQALISSQHATAFAAPQPPLLQPQLAMGGAQVQGSAPSTPLAAKSGGGGRVSASRVSLDGPSGGGAGGGMSAQDRFKAAHGWKVKELMSFSMSTSARGRVRKTACEPFTATLIHLYGDGDLSLREWLLRNYPRPNSTCPAAGCTEPIESHSRTFVHGGARITLSWVTLDPQAMLPGAKDNQVWMWMRPKGKGHVASRDIRRVPLPPEAACISWAALLQLFMKGEYLDLASRCVHYDFVRYFGIGRTVLCVFQDRLRLYTPVLPERSCTYSHKAQLQWLRDEASDLLLHGDDAFSTIERLLLSAQTGSGQSAIMPQGPPSASDSPAPGTSTPAIPDPSQPGAADDGTVSMGGGGGGGGVGTGQGTSPTATAGGGGGLLSAALQNMDAQQNALDAQLRTHWLPMLYADRASLKHQVTMILQSVWHVTTPQQPSQQSLLSSFPTLAPNTSIAPSPVVNPRSSLIINPSQTAQGYSEPSLTTTTTTLPQVQEDSSTSGQPNDSNLIPGHIHAPGIATAALGDVASGDLDSMARRCTEISFANPWSGGPVPMSTIPPQDMATIGLAESFSLSQTALEQQSGTAADGTDASALDSGDGAPAIAGKHPPAAPEQQMTAPATVTTPGGLMDLVEAQQQVARTKRTLSYTLLTWVSRLQDNTAFTAACASMSASICARSSNEPSVGSMGAAGMATGNHVQLGASPGHHGGAAAAAATEDASRMSAAGEPLVALPSAAPSGNLFMSLSTMSNASGRVLPAMSSAGDEGGGGGGGGIDRSAMAVPIVVGSGGPVALAAVADLVVRSAANTRANVVAMGGDGSSRLAQSGSLLEGSASMLAMVSSHSVISSGGAGMSVGGGAGGGLPTGGNHSRRPSNFGGGDTLQMSPSRPAPVNSGPSVTSNTGSAGGPRRSGTNTPLRAVSPAASEMGGDDDEDEEEEEDDDDEEGHGYGWLGRSNDARGGHGEYDDDDDSAFYPQALHSLVRSEDQTSTSTIQDSVSSMAQPHHHQSQPGSILVSAFRNQVPHPSLPGNTNTSAPQGVPEITKRLSFHLGTTAEQAAAAAVAQTQGGTALPPLAPGSVRTTAAGGVGTPPNDNLMASGVLQNIALGGSASRSFAESEREREGGHMPMLKKAPTLRAIQGVARKLGNLVNNSNAAVIGRLYLPCRTILPDTPMDILCPIYDLEYTSIIAYSLSSKFYQQHLNVAFKALLQASRGHKDVATAASWTAAGGGLGPSISHLTLGHSHSLLTGGGLASANSSNGGLAGVNSLRPNGPSYSGTYVGAPPFNPTPTLGSGAEGPRGVVPNGMSVTPNDWAAVLCSSEPYHITHMFEDLAQPTPWTRAKFQVVVYFAPQFAELRRQLVQGGEGAFVTSITRCIPWEQRGGKSNAFFAKTKDDRYIVKSLSKTEKSSFLAIAPDYFRHMSRRHLSGSRSCLAKILGVFTVTIKPTTAGGPSNVSKDTVMDLIVQENCFYDRPIARIYDLKGSERNRFNPKAPVNPNEWSCEVALDDNLREEIQRIPYFVAPSAHADLLAALWEDTAFLSKLGVMDYSLLVGVDNHNRLLAMAVIDYIRQYTLDKKMETWVKGSGILGGNGKEPTIISPRDYRIRFRRAILSYFTRVPGSAALRDLPIPDDLQD